MLTEAKEQLKGLLSAMDSLVDSPDITTIGTSEPIKLMFYLDEAVFSCKCVGPQMPIRIFTTFSARVLIPSNTNPFLSYSSPPVPRSKPKPPVIVMFYTFTKFLTNHKRTVTRCIINGVLK